MCQRLCPVCLPPEPEHRGGVITTNRILWDLDDVAREFDVDLEEEDVRRP